MKERVIAERRNSFVDQALKVIRNRVDQFGVAEPTIQKQGDNRILVQLPGVQDPARAKALIGKTAVLEFKLVDEAAPPDRAVQGGPPPGDELLYGRRVDRDTKTEVKVPYVVKKETLLTGDLISDASVRVSDAGEPYVSVGFDSVGARVFGEVTERNVGKSLAIVLDGNVHSAPVIRERIPSGQAQISGGFTFEEASDLAIVLRTGALQAPVQVLEERTVGPSLGADSIRKGVVSTLAGALAVFLFMVIYYRLAGVIADVALVLNLVILLAAMVWFQATLTLPGIAGIVLTIGMAVDTNILIFERIREEFRLGKTVRAAIEAGFRRAFTTVIDTHVTVVVSGAILYQFGTGPVKGFAVSLMIGIVASLFTAVFFTRAGLRPDLHGPPAAADSFDLRPRGQERDAPDPRQHAVRLRPMAAVGLSHLGDRHPGRSRPHRVPGGTPVRHRLLRRHPVAGPLRAADHGGRRPERAGAGAGRGERHPGVRRRPGVPDPHPGRSGTRSRRSPSGSTAAFERLVSRVSRFGGSSSWDPRSGRDLQWDAVQAVLWGMVGILVYTAMRFDFKGGVAAIIALLHDVVISVGAMSMAHREMSLPVLAALLTIVGFSINDTIVTFDRIRENRGAASGGARRWRTSSIRPSTRRSPAPS